MKYLKGFSYVMAVLFSIFCWYVLLTWMFSWLGVAHASPYSSKEIELYRAINQVRVMAGHDRIPFSPQLQRLASFHALELRQSRRLSHDFLDCNVDLDPQCMWEAPKRLGNTYPPPVFEIAASGVQNANEALQGWLSSNQHRSVILNQGVWANKTWMSMACGHDGSYAVCWFGESLDTTPIDVTGIWYDSNNQGQGVQLRTDDSGLTEGVWYEKSNGNVMWKVFTFRTELGYNPIITIIDPHLIEFETEDAELLLQPFE